MRKEAKTKNDVSAGQLLPNQSACEWSPAQFLAACDETSSNFFDITIGEGNKRRTRRKLYLRRGIL
jgi:hypothetical protein